jgi:hypothetical protein
LRKNLINLAFFEFLILRGPIHHHNEPSKQFFLFFSVFNMFNSMFLTPATTNDIAMDRHSMDDLCMSIMRTSFMLNNRNNADHTQNNRGFPNSILNNDNDSGSDSNTDSNSDCDSDNNGINESDSSSDSNDSNNDDASDDDTDSESKEVVDLSPEELYRAFEAMIKSSILEWGFVKG